MFTSVLVLRILNTKFDKVSHPHSSPSHPSPTRFGLTLFQPLRTLTHYPVPLSNMTKEVKYK